MHVLYVYIHYIYIYTHTYNIHTYIHIYLYKHIYTWLSGKLKQVTHIADIIIEHCVPGTLPKLYV